jgi:hypothetical protein
MTISYGRRNSGRPRGTKSLYQAFSRAKDEWLERLDSGAANSASDQKYGKLRKVVGHDPLPDGAMRGSWARCRPEATRPRDPYRMLTRC